jgi:hypothetical protein
MARAEVGMPQVWHALHCLLDCSVADKVAAAAQVQCLLPGVCQEQQRGVTQQAAQAGNRQQACPRLCWKEREQLLRAFRLQQLFKVFAQQAQANGM